MLREAGPEIFKMALLVKSPKTADLQAVMCCELGDQMFSVCDVAVNYSKYNQDSSQYRGNAIIL